MAWWLEASQQPMLISWRMPKSRNPINHMTVAFKQSAVQAVGSYRHAPLYEDYDLWVRLLVASYQFANLPDVLVYARAGEAMYERRGGLSYAKHEIAMQQNFYGQGFLTIAQSHQKTWQFACLYDCCPMPYAAGFIKSC